MRAPVFLPPPLTGQITFYRDSPILSHYSFPERMTGHARDLLKNYLLSLQKRGITHLPLSEDVRPILRTWFLNTKHGAHTQQPQGQLAPRDIPPQAPSATPAIQEDTVIHLPDGTLDEQWHSLRNLAQHWKPAQELGTLRNTMVFAVGNPRAELMLIGEAPGAEEEKMREPFVGPAGMKLTQILSAMGMERSQVYITNIVKFRPSLPNQGSRNRPPSQEEMNACLPIIRKEIELVRPKLIITLGNTATCGLLNKKESVSSMRGVFHDFNGIPVRVTYHPSYLLRSDSLSEKRKVWEDMLAVMKTLNMPISEKQRQYFLPKAGNRS